VTVFIIILNLDNPVDDGKGLTAAMSIHRGPRIGIQTPKIILIEGPLLELQLGPMQLQSPTVSNLRMRFVN